MDLATIVGLVGGFVVLIAAIILGGSPAGFIQMASILITVGGAVMATIVSFPLEKFKDLTGIIRTVFRGKRIDPDETIETLIYFAEKARREGFLALEDDLEELDDRYLKKGLQLVVDGTDPEIVREVLEIDIRNIDSRHKNGKKIFESLAEYAPPFGMIGTLIGLIQMLRIMEDPSKIGVAMATALLTTLYGVVIAYGVAGPIANKLDYKNGEEILSRELMLEGILSILSGDNPRIVKEKLLSYLSPRIDKEPEEARRSDMGETQVAE